jgi:AcrR family transcriptional regulator
MTPEVLKMAMAAMSDPQTQASDVARRLGITTTTLYAYVNGDGAVKEIGQRLLEQHVGGVSPNPRKFREG